MVNEYADGQLVSLDADGNNIINNNQFANRNKSIHY